MAAFPTTVATDSDLYIAVNATSTQLTDNPLSNVATTVNVVSTTGFPAVGFISIDNEIIKYTATTGTSFTGCTRGVDGSTAASHVQNSQVFHNVVAVHHNALKDDLIAVESFLSTHLGLTTTVTGTEFQRLSGVTSSIQTQLNTKATDTLVVHLAGTETITGAKTFSAAVVVSAGAGNTFTVNTNDFIVDSTNHRIAIGGVTTSPTTTLHARTDDTNDLRFYLHHNNATGDPSIQFDTNGQAWTIGTDNSDSDKFKISSGSVLGVNDLVEFNISGNINILLGDLTVTRSSIAGTVTNGVANTDNTNGSSNAKFFVSTGGSVGGDPYIHYLTTGAIAWATGIDNSDSDKWKLCNANDLTGGDVLRADAGTACVAIKGTNTNDSAPTGWIGEAIRSAQSTPQSSPGTGQFYDVTSISLTAGDWDVSGLVNFTLNGATQTVALMAITTTAGNSVTGQVDGDNRTAVAVPVTNNDRSGVIPCWRLTLTATTTVYLKARMDFSAGTPQAFGRISARRVR